MDQQKDALTPRAALNQVAEQIADFAVGFVRLREKSGHQDAELAGSGTLVSIDGTKAILTADHVLEHLPNREEIGLILPTRFQPQLHRLTIKMELASKMSVARGTIDSEGPDLGLIVLSDAIAGSLPSTKSFYNLTKRRNQILLSPLSIDSGVWFLAGMACEWTEDALPERGYGKVKIFRGLVGAGVVTKEYTWGKYDFLDFEAKYDENYEGPNRFGGFSGGGLWQSLIGQFENGVFCAQDPILSGVAFYESAMTDNLRTISCHGRQSLYKHVVDVVRNHAH